MLFDRLLHGQIRHVEIALTLGIVEHDGNAHAAARKLAAADCKPGYQYNYRDAVGL